MSSETVTIFFSDGSTLSLKSGDEIIPVISSEQNGETCSTLSNPVTIGPHIHHGLIPSVLDALCRCNFFFVGDDTTTVYCSNSIIKIQNS